MALYQNSRTCIVISVETYLERIGTDKERKLDRKFAYHMSMWHWRQKWEAAKRADDYDAMALLDKQLNMLSAL